VNVHDVDAVPFAAIPPDTVHVPSNASELLIVVSVENRIW